MVDLSDLETGKDVINDTEYQFAVHARVTALIEAIHEFAEAAEWLVYRISTPGGDTGYIENTPGGMPGNWQVETTGGNASESGSARWRISLPWENWEERLSAFGVASYETANRISADIDTPRNLLNGEVGEHEGSMGNIRDNTENWTDDGEANTAANLFGEHINHLNDVLVNQRDAIIALQAISQVHANVIARARLSALSIADTAIAEIAELAENEAIEQIESEIATIQSIVDIATSALSGNPESLVKSTINNLAEISLRAVTDGIGGSQPWDVIDKMLEALDTLEDHAVVAEEEIQGSLEMLVDLIGGESGQHDERFVPKEVSLPD